MAIMKDSQLDTNVWAFGGMTPSELIDKPLRREGAEERGGEKGGKGQENGFSDSERAAWSAESGDLGNG